MYTAHGDDADMLTDPEARPVAVFAELTTFLERSPPTPLQPGTKICVVTNEMVAFHKNGGIGTANSGLIDALSQRGCRLSVIYTGWLDLEADDVRNAIADIRKRDIEFSCLQESVPPEWMHSPRKVSYACYWLLRRQNPAIVHFNDFLGNGFYAAQARHSGTALGDTAVIVTAHGPSRWAFNIDERPIATLEEQEICFLEERTLEFADAVLGVSHHLLKWLHNEGVTLPKHSYVHKNIVPNLRGPPGPRLLEPGDLTEVVFFGRQDIRKGFKLMLKAVRELSITLPQLKITFLGKFSSIEAEHSGALALDELRNVPNPIDFRHDLGRDEALHYLRRQGVLAVIPSLDENSPCTVLECLTEGVPFIASAVGGILELIAAASHATVLFEPTATALAAKIQEVAEKGVGAAVLAFEPLQIAEQMARGFAALQAQVNLERQERFALVARQSPLVSVVITHFNRHTLLHNLLATLERQTYRNFEVVVIDDGSTDTASVAYVRGLSTAKFSYQLTIVRTENRYVGAARNIGVGRARGEFVKFQDDDNLPMPHEIEYFVRAALFAEADIVTGMSRFFRDELELHTEIELAALEYFPLGASLPLALTKNEYGDGNALVRRDCFLDDGGFTEIHGVGWEDYEFFVKSESIGRKIVFIPEPLFNYRVSDVGMLQSTSAYRGAQRARAGLRLHNKRWLKNLIDFVHQSTIARDSKNQGRWRAGRRQFGDLHREMTEGAPDSPDNIQRLLDLAADYGRHEDLNHMVGGRPRVLKFSSFPNIELVHPTENLPIGFALMKVSGDCLLVHPLSNRETQVLVRQALPANTKKVSVKFSHRNARGGAVRMGFKVISDGSPVIDSGWVDVLPGGKAYATVVLDTIRPDACDLLLRSTIDGSQNCAWSYADHICIET